jgi:hypothetical protein
MGKLRELEVSAWFKTGKRIAGRSDGNGLTFTLSPKGSASWVLRYRFAGRMRELTLGRYPERNPDASAEFNDFTTEFVVGRDLHDQPFEPNRLVGKHWPAKAHPELKTHHRSLRREIRPRQTEKKGGCVRAARDEATVPTRRCNLGVMVHGIGVANRKGVLANSRGRERDLGREALVRVSSHRFSTPLSVPASKCEDAELPSSGARGFIARPTPC